MSVVDSVWYGTSAAAKTARIALTPASWLFRAAVYVRAWRYDTDALRTRVAALPALSVGNLTVGGTGKTPVAAWAAAGLRARGGAPAVIMRGHGGDEPLVHARLNPDVPIIVNADRVRGAQLAQLAGADCAVLDDAFQHRRIARVSDWVLVSAERWSSDLRMLPAGPLREPIGALRRADLLIVTRKHVASAEAEAIGERLVNRFPSLGFAQCHLTLGALTDPRTGASVPLSWLRGRPVVATAAVGNASAFFRQLGQAGATVEARPFKDHHAFDSNDVVALCRAAEDKDGVICTLKDAVKLAPLWPPAAAPLWYVSQIAVFERGSALLDRALDAVLAARQGVSSTAGVAGSQFP